MSGPSTYHPPPGGRHFLQMQPAHPQHFNNPPDRRYSRGSPSNRHYQPRPQPLPYSHYPHPHHLPPHDLHNSHVHPIPYLAAPNYSYLPGYPVPWHAPFPPTRPPDDPSTSTPPAPSLEIPYLEVIEQPQAIPQVAEKPDPSPASPSQPAPVATSPPSSVSASPRITIPQLSMAEYVIWPKPPTDPSTAPGLIISSLARPTDEVRQNALDLPFPSSPAPVQNPEPRPSPSHSADVVEQTTTTTTTASVPNTSVPTTPISSITSLSAVVSFSAVKTTLDDQLAAEAELITADPPPVLEPPPSAPVPKPVAVKPSWASLLRQDGATKGNTLPKSSVVGFSVPASASTRPPGHANRVLSLLNTGYNNTPLMKIRPRGLVNTGNMCFANAVLQVLMYCPPFWTLFHDLGRVMDDTLGDDDEARSKTPLVDATVRFLREFIPGKGKDVDHGADEEDVTDSFIPSYVYDALKEKKRFDHMRGGHQEDAEEFLGFYLDTLEEELSSLGASLQPNSTTSKPQSEEQNGNAVEDGPWLEVGKRNRLAFTRTTKTAESPITRIFGGKFRSTLRVPHQKDSIIYEDWRSLRLDIQGDRVHSIKDALSHISTPQTVQVTSVTRPGTISDATQTVHIDSLPPILILHLKRFLYDATAGGVAKVDTQVSFPPQVEIGSDVMAAGRKMNTVKYKLFGAIYHHGPYASGGHYTLDVLHPALGPSGRLREGWIRIDDELVSDIRAEDVFSPSETCEYGDRCAYLLFYRRVSGTRT